MTNSDLQFIPFAPELSEHFYHINKQWIESMFVLEPVDNAMLEDPYTYIIQPGGYIYFAKHPELGIIGTCALMKMSDGVFELTKMAVLDTVRGLKVGERLLRYVLEQAKALPIEKLFLLTNKKCEAAIHLYEKNGFVHSQAIMDAYGAEYERCNVAMDYPLIDG